MILSRIKTYTKYLYFHILGEPWLQPDIDKFIDYDSKNGFYVNITTNGYLIERLRNVNNIRQINVSLHSYDEKYGMSLFNYLDKIFDVISGLDSTFFSLRI